MKQRHEYGTGDLTDRIRYVQQDVCRTDPPLFTGQSLVRVRLLTLRMSRARVPPPPPAGDTAELPSMVGRPSCILLHRPLADVIGPSRVVTNTCYASRVEHLHSTR